jgi:thiamine-phosphate pyrophosphorylase
VVPDALPAFYPIIDTGLCAARGIDPLHLAAACVRGGARLLQLRQKDGSSAERLDRAERLVAVARDYGAAVVVNDRADVAKLAGAAGVHVGQDDVSPEDVRTLLGPDAIVGLSTHTDLQVDDALGRPVSYVAVGPVFGTGTKVTGYAARGLSIVRYASGRGRPVVAIGGITLDRVRQVLDAGAASVAVVSDLFAEGDDVEARVRRYLDALAPHAS